MNIAAKIVIPAVLLMLLTAGCYTKFYHPGMERDGTGPYSQIYNRYDSTAIDTTLTKPEYEGYDSYPYYDNWSYWGRPRGRTLWGFDFYNFSPDYYWSYYGYYDYYGTPWWYSRNDPWYWWYPNPGGSGVPAEPPSKRPGLMGRPEGGGNYGAPPPAPPGGGTYARPPENQPPPSDGAKQGPPPNTTKPQGQQPPPDPNKRGGREGR
ncbi:hypothetical protein KKH27_14455 [bacterium]|nr:hypothetical protein [bacterium]MBU1983627.1 hypothetical protein [bacterium]